MASNHNKNFTRGVSSVLKLYPATVRYRTSELRARILARSPIDAIAIDMSMVGKDLAVATEKFSQDVDTRPSTERTPSATSSRD